jgi:hypothetical protein
MFSTYRDIAKVWAEEDFPFSPVTCSPDTPVLNRPSAVKQKEALENGAAESIWDASAETPSYFPLLYTNDVLKGLLDNMEIYIQRIKRMEHSSENWTCVHVNSAVIPDEFEYAEKLHALFAKLDENGRLGGKE